MSLIRSKQISDFKSTSPTFAAGEILGGSIVSSIASSAASLGVSAATSAAALASSAGAVAAGAVTVNGTQATAISNISTSVAANTAKTGITTDQANAIVANTAKTGITTDQANAIVANTAKTGITTGQSTAIVANTAKVTNATHSGDVTGATTLTIANNAVTNAKAADMSVNTIKGRITASTGDPEDLTAANIRTIINVANGATANSADATLLARGNHTGTQLASTISDFQATVTANTAVAANSAKIGITTDQANAIAANTAKTGITTDQSTAIVANTAKVTNANHSGDVTGATALTIANDVVTNAKLANMAVNTIKGRAAAGTGDPEDLTAANIRTIINVANGATANSADATLLARGNHTGTQLASTISDFQATVTANTAVSTNTLKVGITGAQASAISTNTLKVGITTDQANAIVTATSVNGTQSTAILNANTSIASVVSSAGSINTRLGNVSTSTANVVSSAGSINTRLGLVSTAASDAVTSNSAQQTAITNAVSSLTSINTAYFKLILIEKFPGEVTAANTPVPFTLQGVKDGLDSNVISVKINGIGLNFSEPLTNGWNLDGTTVLNIMVPYGIDAQDTIEVHYIK